MRNALVGLAVGVVVGLSFGIEHGKFVQYREDKIAVKSLVNEIVTTLNTIHTHEIDSLKKGGK